jgi:Pentapeptide repeats (8 copies)
VRRPDKIPRKGVSRFTKDLVEDLVAPARQPSRDQVLWATRIVLLLAVLLAILTLIGLPFGITLWAWVKLLIVPVVLAIGGFLFTRSENRATQGVAERRAQDEALQAYLDHIGDLLLDTKEPLRQSKEGRTLARARSLTMLTRLDNERKGSVVRFLFEAELITKGRVVITLSGADLSGADLYSADLSGADLSGTDLSDADLSSADLSGADLSGADLTGTSLYGADLTDALVTDEQVAKASMVFEIPEPVMIHEQVAEALRATMPNGQKYEDWLKAREKRGERLTNRQKADLELYDENLRNHTYNRASQNSD